MRRIVMPCLTAALAAAGCEEPVPFEIDVEISPTALELDKATYLTPPRAKEFQVRNVLGSDIYLSAAFDRIDDELGDLLVVELPQRQIELPSFTVIEPDRTALLRVTLDESHWRWRTGDYTVELPLEVRYFFSGQGSDQPETISPNQAPEPIAKIFRVNVAFSLDCDLDGDGFEATECGGDDCRDDLDYAYPGADETCDAVDRDCDGGTVDQAIDRVPFYVDADRDQSGDPETRTLACSAPRDGQNWVTVAGDCDDESSLINDRGPEVGVECLDGIDNDCDGDIDLEDSDC